VEERRVTRSHVVKVTLSQPNSPPGWSCVNLLLQSHRSRSEWWAFSHFRNWWVFEKPVARGIHWS